MEVRQLRYFVTVAECEHFGRAAEALHIAQPVLSRQIRALEDELKAQLFVRDKRATELTPAGQQLLADAGPLLARADDEDELSELVLDVVIEEFARLLGLDPQVIDPGYPDVDDD